ncbi:hypothetical protein ACWCPI_05445 [Streptomyces sp. NPDC001920]
MPEYEELDPRTSRGYQDLLNELPQMANPPLVAEADLRELVKIKPILDHLQFPINSAGQMLNQLGGPTATFDVLGVQVSPARMIKYLPASFFPVQSMESLVEKLAEVMRENRKQVDAVKELKQLRTELPQIQYPVQNRSALAQKIGPNKVFRVMGRYHRVADAVSAVTDDMFPITSQGDLERKIAYLMQNRPLIRPHEA